MKYPFYTLKLFKEKHKLAYKYRTTRKKSLRYRLSRLATRDLIIYIRVVYDYGWQNEGEYTTKKEALYAYECFTEQDLINDFL